MKLGVNIGINFEIEEKDAEALLRITDSLKPGNIVIDGVSSFLKALVDVIKTKKED